jgi:hypothetical protein
MAISKIIRYGLLNSILASAYIALVALLLSNAQKLFGPQNNIISMVAFLLTFVFSAALMGVIVFGRPILWYLDGFKKEAVKLIFYTLFFLFIIMVVIFLTLLIT